MENKLFLLTIAFMIFVINVKSQQIGSFTDSRDGKTYKTVKIGTQTWMAENLAYKPISGNYWAYDNNSSNVSKYGYLYDWKTAKNVCPSGWHLPSDAEWTQLIEYLGGSEIAGKKMKSTSGWNENGNGTNQSGFNGFPCGFRNGDGKYSDVGYYASWWGSAESSTDTEIAWGKNLNFDNSKVLFNDGYKWRGFSVRCLKD